MDFNGGELCTLDMPYGMQPAGYPRDPHLGESGPPVGSSGEQPTGAVCDKSSLNHHHHQHQHTMYNFDCTPQVTSLNEGSAVAPVTQTSEVFQMTLAPPMEIQINESISQASSELAFHTTETSYGQVYTHENVEPIVSTSKGQTVCISNSGLSEAEKGLSAISHSETSVSCHLTNPSTMVEMRMIDAIRTSTYAADRPANPVYIEEAEMAQMIQPHSPPTRRETQPRRHRYKPVCLGCHRGFGSKRRCRNLLSRGFPTLKRNELPAAHAMHMSQKLLFNAYEKSTDHSDNHSAHEMAPTDRVQACFSASADVNQPCSSTRVSATGAVSISHGGSDFCLKETVAETAHRMLAANVLEHNMSVETNQFSSLEALNTPYHGLDSQNQQQQQQQQHQQPHHQTSQAPGLSACLNTYQTDAVSVLSQGSGNSMDHLLMQLQQTQHQSQQQQQQQQQQPLRHQSAEDPGQPRSHDQEIRSECVARLRSKRYSLGEPLVSSQLLQQQQQQQQRRSSRHAASLYAVSPPSATISTRVITPPRLPPCFPVSPYQADDQRVCSCFRQPTVAHTRARRDLGQRGWGQRCRRRSL
ncbi:unnamed protein product [Dibothriocephalus latus]|uniref:Uncharacterized protein n=1 Tax=Dibothriocephalus latus TaxID=60516 RepID=A0A3P7LTP9_DIBLA|nr:unnamed protein product [Dibothriocephalus latus]